MAWTVYLSGEIHTDWREEIAQEAQARGLDATFTAPVTDHAASDDCGVAILGAEAEKVWHDRKGAQLNAIRTRTLIGAADVVVVRFGDQYKQWNAAFDAGYAAASTSFSACACSGRCRMISGLPSAAALAVAETPAQVAALLDYAIAGRLRP
jgi:YtoQ family protein